MVPDRCEATIDRRTLPHEHPADALAEIHRVVARLRDRDPDLDVTVGPLRQGAPIQTPADSPLVVAAQEVAGALGLDPTPVGYQQPSDGRFFAACGIATILLGPGIPDLAHSADEYVDLDEAVTAAKFYAQVAARLLRPQR